MSIEISKISFATKLKELKIESYVKSTKLYLDKIQQVLDLEKDLPIFLDTNVLLKFYSISFVSRKALLNFLKTHKANIYITSQVQKEFVKNREDIIDRFLSDTLEKLEGNFKDEVKNKTQSYVQRNKIFFEDFPLFEKKIATITGDIDKAQLQLEKEILELKSKLSDTKYKDDFLDLIQEFNILDNLTDEEIKFLKFEFDTFKKNLDVSKLKTEVTKPQAAFPGMLDIKEKPENPYGDYIIYHEMIKFQKEKQTDSIFLTYDTSKGDWLKESREPHSHYIQITYLSTEKTLFFIDAEKFFNTHLKRNLNSLIEKIDYYSPQSDFEKDFILNFVGLERIIRIIAEFVVIPRATVAPLSKILLELLERQYINEQTYSKLTLLINYKNILTHAVDRKQIESIKKKSDKILSDLDEMIDLMDSLYSLL